MSVVVTVRLDARGVFAGYEKIVPRDVQIIGPIQVQDTINGVLLQLLKISHPSFPFGGWVAITDTAETLAEKIAEYNVANAGEDDVQAFDDLAGFPAEGEDGIIYLAKDTNLMYRWDVDAEEYVAVSSDDADGDIPALVGYEWDGSPAFQVMTEANNAYILDGDTLVKAGVLYLVQDATGGRAATIQKGVDGDPQVLDLNPDPDTLTAIVYSHVAGKKFFSTDKTMVELPGPAGGGAYEPESLTAFLAMGLDVDDEDPDNVAALDRINAFILGMKNLELSFNSQSAWDNTPVVWGFEGPDLAGQAVNWKAPGTKDIVFSGSPVYEAKVFAPDGVDDVGDPSFINNNDLTNGPDEYSQFIGIAEAPTNPTTAAFGTSGDGSSYLYLNEPAGGVTYTHYTADRAIAAKPSVGAFVMTWPSANVVSCIQDGVTIQSSAQAPPGAHTTYKSLVGARQNGGGGAVAHTDAKIAVWGTVDAPMTEAEGIAMCTLITALISAKGF